MHIFMYNFDFFFTKKDSYPFFRTPLELKRIKIDHSKICHFDIKIIWAEGNYETASEGNSITSSFLPKSREYVSLSKVSSIFPPGLERVQWLFLKFLFYDIFYIISVAHIGFSSKYACSTLQSNQGYYRICHFPQRTLHSYFC